MGKSKIRPPSTTDSLAFPVFGLTWHGSPSNPKRDGCSVIAYCGGGGSAKTGVGNKIVVSVSADAAADDDSGGDAGAQQSPPSPTFTSRQVEISTGEALCFGVYAFRPYDDNLKMVRLIACVGDEILMYGIPLSPPSSEGDAGEADGSGEEKKEEAILLARTNLGKGYGANVSTYTALFQNGKLNHCIATGCENGIVVIYYLHQTGPQSFEFEKLSECHGHTKAICAVNFHPRGTQLLSSAKDGTARVFDVHSGSELALLKCEVHDPNGPPPVEQKATMKTKDPRMMKRPPMILVRGCAYGDLEGKNIYTVASGKRGPAYLTKWRTLVPLNKAVGGGGGPPSGASPSGGPPGASGGRPPTGKAPPTTTSAPNTQQKLEVKQEYRIQCSPVPISATSLSADGTVLTLGSVEGSILLYNLESQSVSKQFKEVHDLPVTCVASRPVPNMLMLPGELEGGVNFDAVSASADNKLGRWTLQKKSRIKKEKQSSGSSRKMGALEEYIWSLLRIPLLLMALLTAVAIRDTVDICGEELGLSALVMDAGRAGHCLYREVLWAEESRVSFVPV